MITFFTTAKPFTGRAAVPQYNILACCECYLYATPGPRTGFAQMENIHALSSNLSPAWNLGRKRWKPS